MFCFFAQGCLAAPVSVRFSAYTSPEFLYTKLVDQNQPEGATETLDADDMVGESAQQASINMIKLQFNMVNSLLPNGDRRIIR